MVPPPLLSPDGAALRIAAAAAGQARMITADMIRPGAAVIDVGVNRIADPSKASGFRLSGDVDFAGVSSVAGWITPVPGGVGPMTITMLLVNTLEAAERSAIQPGSGDPEAADALRSVMARLRTVIVGQFATAVAALPPADSAPAARAAALRDWALLSHPGMLSSVGANSCRCKFNKIVWQR
jgi:hypothetical protein